MASDPVGPDPLVTYSGKVDVRATSDILGTIRVFSDLIRPTIDSCYGDTDSADRARQALSTALIHCLSSPFRGPQNRQKLPKILEKIESICVYADS